MQQKHAELTSSSLHYSLSYIATEGGAVIVQTFSSLTYLMLLIITKAMLKIPAVPVVRKVDTAPHWVNLYSLDNTILVFPKTQPLDSDFSSGLNAIQGQLPAAVQEMSPGKRSGNPA